MTEETPAETCRMETQIVGLYNVLYEDSLAAGDIELYELTEDAYEGEIYLPYIGINFDLWEDWSTEKRIEVLVHEFAHTENYDDDHHPDFWDRVVELTEIALDHRAEVEELFDEIDPQTLKRTVVDSVHEHVIERDIDTVADRRRAVSRALDVPSGQTCSD